MAAPVETDRKYSVSNVGSRSSNLLLDAQYKRMVQKQYKGDAFRSLSSNNIIHFACMQLINNISDVI